MKYNVTYERDEDGLWVASIEEVEGCHTQGRTIDQTRRRLREALSLFVDDAETAKFEERIRLSKEARKAIDRVKKLREDEARVSEELREWMRMAVQVLTGDLNLSVRDAGELLDLSHQRVHQLAGHILANESASKRRSKTNNDGN